VGQKRGNGSQHGHQVLTQKLHQTQVTSALFTIASTTSHTMPLKVNFFRLLVIPACIVWGVLELFRLQRSRLLLRR